MEALIAGTYLAGTNTRRVRRALAALFKGAIGKDAVSRIWRKVKTDWEAWSKRPLDAEDIVRLILDGTVVRVRLDKKATSISLLVVLGVRRDGQKVLLAVKNMGGESEAAWRALLDDLVARGLKTPEFLIVDGAAGLEKALAALWPEVPTQRCTVHKHQNLLDCVSRGKLNVAGAWRSGHSRLFRIRHLTAQVGITCASMSLTRPAMGPLLAARSLPASLRAPSPPPISRAPAANERAGGSR